MAYQRYLDRLCGKDLQGRPVIKRNWMDALEQLDAEEDSNRLIHKDKEQNYD